MRASERASRLRTRRISLTRTGLAGYLYARRASSVARWRARGRVRSRPRVSSARPWNCQANIYGLRQDREMVFYTGIVSVLGRICAGTRRDSVREGLRTRSDSLRHSTLTICALKPPRTVKRSSPRRQKKSAFDTKSSTSCAHERVVRDARAAPTTSPAASRLAPTPPPSHSSRVHTLRPPSRAFSRALLLRRMRCS